MTLVHRYGVHYAGSVGFLLQKGEAQSVYGIDSPFRLTRSRHPCPHDINLSERDDTHRHLLEDPLVQWLARPQGPVAIVDGPPVALIEKLMEVYSPTAPLLRHAWGRDRSWLQMQLTNIAPLVLFDASSRDMMFLAGAHHYPRPLLALSHEPIPTVPTIHTDLTEVPDQQSMRRFGAWLMHERLKCPN